MLFGEYSPPSRCPNRSRNDVPGVWPSPSQINSSWVGLMKGVITAIPYVKLYAVEKLIKVVEKISQAILR